MIVVISDIHIPYTDKSFLDLADYVSSNDRIRNVVFNGDIIDRVRCTEDDIRKSPQGEKLLEALSKILNSKKCYLVRGNHDPDLGRTLYNLLGVNLPCYEKLKIGGFLFMHGHQFDPVCSRLPWRFLKKIVPWFYRTPREWKERNRKKFIKSVGVVWTNAIDYVEKHKVKNLIIGHTHYPAVIRLETGSVIGDCGDWLDSRSFIKIVNGEITFAQYSKRGKEEVAIRQLTDATKEAIKGDRDTVEMGFENWKRARKKPVIVEFREPLFEVEKIHTREGTLVAKKGEDYVIKGVKGELYPISKEIFHETYEIVDEPNPNIVAPSFETLPEG